MCDSGRCIGTHKLLSACCAAASLSWVEHKEGAGGTPQGSGLSLTACGQHGVVAFGGAARAPHNQLYCLDPAAAAWQRWKPSGVRIAMSLWAASTATIVQLVLKDYASGVHAASSHGCPLDSASAATSSMRHAVQQW